MLNMNVCIDDKGLVMLPTEPDLKPGMWKNRRIQMKSWCYEVHR